MKNRIRNSSTAEKKNGFSRALGRTDILALGFGTMVGWSWVMVMTTWVTKAGFLGSILAFLSGSVVIFIIGITYGELTAALPLAGGEIVYVFRTLGYHMAWAVGWTMSFAYISVAAWESIAIATALDYLLPIPDLFHLWDIAGNLVYLSWAAIGIFCAVIMVLLNLFASRPAMIFQVMATAGFLIVGFIILFGGITFGSAENIGPLFTSVDGFAYVILMVPSMLIGFDVIPQSAEEMNIPLKAAGRMILACIIMAVIWYIAIIIGVSAAAPPEIRVSGLTPAADVITYAFGDNTFGKIVVLGGILGILTCWNGFFMASTRLIFAMGRAKMLPSIFGKLHKKYGTPWAATFLVGGVCVVSPLLGENAFLWFFNASAFCTLFTYFLVALAFMLLRVKEPDLNRPFRVKGGKYVGVAAVILSALYFLLIAYNTMIKSLIAEELVIIGVWIIIGTLFIFIARFQHGAQSKRDRELLIFGEEFARREFLK